MQIISSVAIFCVFCVGLKHLNPGLKRMDVSPMVTYHVFGLRDPLLHLSHSAMKRIKVLANKLCIGLYMVHLASQGSYGLQDRFKIGRCSRQPVRVFGLVLNPGRSLRRGRNVRPCGLFPGTRLVFPPLHTPERLLRLEGHKQVVLECLHPVKG